MLLTYEMLRAKKACPEQANEFRDLFPAGVVLTEALCLAHASDFNFCWAARHLLSASAQEACEKACVPAWEAYCKARASAWEAYDKSGAAPLEAYAKARASAWEAYDKACAAAFFAGWQADHAP